MQPDPISRRGNPLMVKGAPSLNPAGRSKGFRGVARLIAQETGDGAELVAYALRVWRDENESPDRRDRAHQWLSDRFMGKPMASHEILAHVATAQIGPPIGWDALTPEQKRAHLDALQAGRHLALAAATDDSAE